MAETPVPRRPTPASLPEVVRRFWWPVYGEARSHGNPPTAALRICGAVLESAAHGPSFLRSEVHGGRLRLVIQEELKQVLATPERVYNARPLDDISLSEAEERDDYDRFPEETAFDRRWAVVVLEQALAAIRQEFEAEGQGQRLEDLQPYLARRVSDWHTTDISEAVDSVEVDNLRDRFRDQVRRLVGETVTTPMALDAELAELFGAI